MSKSVIQEQSGNFFTNVNVIMNPDCLPTNMTADFF